MSRRKLERAISKTKPQTPRIEQEIPALLGVSFNDLKLVKVPDRPGYVFARVRSNLSEVVHAFNGVVSNTYDLPVLLGRDQVDRSRYYVLGRDLGRYPGSGWGTSDPYLDQHGDRHSFLGGDTTWIYSQQFLPFLVSPGPTGTASIYPYNYYYENEWVYAGNTNTTSLLVYNPTGSSARMVLVYLDTNGAAQLSPGSDYFSPSLTGTAMIYTYIPDPPGDCLFPLAGVMLLSGTSVLGWNNLYDVRPIFDAVNVTGTYAAAAHTHPASSSTPTYPAIYDDNVFKGTGTALHFNDNLTVIASGTSMWIDGQAGGGGGSDLLIYDDGVFKVTGTALVFGDNATISVTGSYAYIQIDGVTGSAGPAGPAGGGAGSIVIYDDDTYKTTGTAIHFNRNSAVIITGSSAWINGNTEYHSIYNVKDYGAIGDGVADDTSSITGTVAAMPATGGILYFPVGTYKTSGGIVLDKPIVVEGINTSSAYDDRDALSRVTCTSSTANLFTVTVYGCSFRNIMLENTAASTPSGGAGIAITAGGDLMHFDNLRIHRFYINVDIQDGWAWEMKGCWLAEPVKYGLKLRHIDLPDGGNGNVTNSYFMSPEGPNRCDAHIRIESGGGHKISNCKINGGSGNWATRGIDVAVGSGVGTSVLLVSNTSIEGVYETAVYAATNSTGTSNWDYMVFNGLQIAFYGGANVQAFNFNAADSGDLDGIVISDSVFYCSAAETPAASAISMTNVNQAKVIGNINIGWNQLISTTNCTNVTSEALTSHLTYNAGDGDFPVAAIYNISSGTSQSFAASSTGTIVNYATEIYDPYGTVTTGTDWRFVAPVDGVYQVSALFTFASSSGWADGEPCSVWIYKNSIHHLRLDRRNTFSTAASTTHELGGSFPVYLSAGDYIDVRVVNGSDGTITNELNSSFGSWVSVHRIYVGDNSIQIYDDNVFATTGTAIHFNENLSVTTSGTSVWIDGQAGGGASTPTYPAVYDDNAFVATGTAFSFTDNLDVSVTGTTVYISAVGVTGTSGATGPAGPTGPAGAATVYYDDSVYKATGSAVSFDNNLSVSVSGTVVYVVGSSPDASGWVTSPSTWTWASADDPSYVVETNANITGTYSAGMRFKISDPTVRQFIVTKVAYDGSNTELTLYGGTDYDLTSGTLSNPFYSTAKAPLGFPLSPTKWTQQLIDANLQTQATPAQNTWYNTGTLLLSIPIGVWCVQYKAVTSLTDASSTTWGVDITLSTANNSESDTNFTNRVAAGSIISIIGGTFVEKVLNIDAKTSYYLNIRTPQTGLDNMYIRGDIAPTIIRAICAYL